MADSMPSNGGSIRQIVYAHMPVPGLKARAVIEMHFPAPADTNRAGRDRLREGTYDARPSLIRT